MIKISNNNRENGEHLNALEQARKDVDEILKNVNKKFSNNTIKDNDADSVKDNKQFSKEQVDTINESDKNDSNIKIDLSYIEGEKTQRKVKSESNSDSGNKLDKSSAKQNQNTPPKNTLKIADDNRGSKGNIKTVEAISHVNGKSESINEQREQIRKLMIALEEERELRAKSERTIRGIRALALVALIISIISIIAQVIMKILPHYL